MKQDFHQLAAVEAGRINRRIFADPEICDSWHRNSQQRAKMRSSSLS